jgi:carboxyl-terminal processing protease
VSLGGLFRLKPAGFIFLFALAAHGFGQSIELNPLAKQEVLDQISDVITKSAFVPGLDFKKWPEILKQEQEKIDAAKNDDEFQRAVNSALRKFGATHTALTSPRVAAMMQSGETVGVGLSSQRTPDGLLVTRTVPDAPAERGGIVPGDLIIAVDGKEGGGGAAIAGKEGSDVTLTVRHANKTTEEYILTRRKFSTVRPEELTWIDKNTARLAIYTFDYTYKHEHVEELMKQAEGSANLILDLRDNGGGSIANFRKLLGLFVSPTKPVGTFIDRRMVDDYVAATKGSSTDLASIAAWSPRKLRATPSETLPLYKGHVVVLVNGMSGSAAEIVAAGLRDTIGATVVGTKSAGAVLVSQYISATNGFMFQYPVSDYVTIRGTRLEGVGVTPDVSIAGPTLYVQGATDEAVKKAVEVFASAKSGAPLPF